MYDDRHNEDAHAEAAAPVADASAAAAPAAAASSSAISSSAAAAASSSAGSALTNLPPGLRGGVAAEILITIPGMAPPAPAAPTGRRQGKDSRSTPRKTYLCSKCGQPKKGHICTNPYG